MLSHAGAGKARPDPDGGRHRHRQEHHAGLDARAAQPADGRPHPDHRGPDRVPVHATRSRSSTSARSAATRRSLQIGAEERAAPGARLHPDRRDPRPRDHDLGDLATRCRATWCWPRCTPTTATTRSAASCRFYTPEARPALLADLAAGPARHRLAAPAARQRRRPRAGGRGAAQHQAGLRADREGRLRRRQGGDGEVAGRRLADLRAGPRAPDHRRRDHRATRAWPTPTRRPT